jgi:hypothetical protein
MYTGVGNITRIYEVCKQYFGLEQGTQTMDKYYNQVVAICKERNMYQPLSTGLKKMERIIVGIYMAHHLHLPTRFLFVRILQLHMDHWLARAHL